MQRSDKMFVVAMNKDPESWSHVRAESVMAGSKAQRVNVFRMALQDIEIMSRAKPGVVTIPAELLDALQVMVMAWETETSRDGRRHIGLGDDCSFPAMRDRINSVSEATALLRRYRPEFR